jgi:FKBP-type peptidyl-prolyl cis-trans isomerase FkpA
MRNLIIVAAVALLAGLTACNQQPGKTKTEHGYYVTNHTNKGGEKPVTGDVVRVHVTTYVGDSLMQSTREMSPEPRDLTIPDLSQMPAGRKVPALFDALFMAGEGDSLTVYQDVDTTIQRQLPAALKNEKYVRYEVSLVEVITKADQDKKKAEGEARFKTVETDFATALADFKAGKLKDKITKLESGVQVYIVEKGNGTALKVGEQIKTEYYGALQSNGKMFDNSFQRGEPLPFALGVGQMIPGFDEGAQQLNHGGKAYVFLPAKTGYGAQGTPDGSIPPNSDLVFYIEVL